MVEFSLFIFQMRSCPLTHQMFILPSACPTATQSSEGWAARHVGLARHCMTSTTLLSLLTLCRRELPPFSKLKTSNSLVDIMAARKEP